MFGNEETLAHVKQLLLLQKQENLGFDVDSVIQSSYKFFTNMYSELGIEGSSNTAVDLQAHQISGNQLNNDELNVITVEPNRIETAFTCCFLDLPVQVQLHIFSFLTAPDLCCASQTCRTWNDLCSDHLLWKYLLRVDQQHWETVSHRTNPAVYRAVNSDLSQKEIYLRCCPYAQPVSRPSGLQFSFPKLFRFLVPKKSPKIVMFGPGLECDATSSIVRKFLGERPDVFKTCGGFPGEFPGSVGTGFYVQMENAFQIRLITLYSGTRKDRENQQGQRASRNKLLVAAAPEEDDVAIEIGNHGNGNDETEQIFDVNYSVKELCRTVDAFVFVVNADASSTSSAAEGRPELLAIMNERWTDPSIPLLILACVENQQIHRLPCITVAEQLKLHKMNRVWKMYNCNVDTLSGVTDGIKWVKNAADSR